MLELAAGDATVWDELSRPKLQTRDGNAALSIHHPLYDLASRPSEEEVGQRGALKWKYDLYSRPIETELPLGIGRSEGDFRGFRRQFDQLDRLVDIGALGTEPGTTTLGGSWTWGGPARLWSFQTKGALGTGARLTYLGGPNSSADIPSGAKWQLGSLTWGSLGTSTATETPAQIWGQFNYGWRGTEGDPRDGAKIGRQASKQGLDLFAAMGWSWDYDVAQRLIGAFPGRGSLTGTTSSDAIGFRYEYGEGDELELIIDEYAGKLDNIETGAYGRITKRGDTPYLYDQAGRRTEDEKHIYIWDWRSQLRQITLKDGQTNAGHQVRYDYDAQGRMTVRRHLGPLPKAAPTTTIAPSSKNANTSGKAPACSAKPATATKPRPNSAGATPTPPAPPA